MEKPCDVVGLQAFHKSDCVNPLSWCQTGSVGEGRGEGEFHSRRSRKFKAPEARHLSGLFESALWPMDLTVHGKHPFPIRNI